MTIRFLLDTSIVSSPISKAPNPVIVKHLESAGHECAIAADRERARLEGLGRPAPYVDGQIAAIALVNDLVLVTANVKDFARFKALEVENWSRRRG